MQCVVLPIDSDIHTDPHVHSMHDGHVRLQVVPCLRVPTCSTGEATISHFYNNTAPVGLLRPLQETEVSVCWDATGLKVRTRAWDTNIFSNATKCNDDVWALGDVLEVFLGPVEHPTDDPMWCV